MSLSNIVVGHLSAKRFLNISVPAGKDAATDLELWLPMNAERDEQTALYLLHFMDELKSLLSDRACGSMRQHGNFVIVNASPSRNLHETTAQHIIEIVNAYIEYRCFGVAQRVNTRGTEIELGRIVQTVVYTPGDTFEVQLDLPDETEIYPGLINDVATWLTAATAWYYGTYLQPKNEWNSLFDFNIYRPIGDRNSFTRSMLRVLLRGYRSDPEYLIEAADTLFTRLRDTFPELE